MKTLIISAIALVAIAYGGHWYYKADEAKKVVAAQIDQMAKNDPDYNLTHDPVSVKGFPLSYEVSIPNFKLVSKKTDSAENGDVKQIHFDGNVVIGTDLWGTAFWVEKKGVAKISLAPSGNQFIADVDTSLSANVENPDKTQAFNHPFSTAAASFFDLSQEGYQINWDRIKKGEVATRQFNLKGVEGDHKDQELMKFDHLNLSWTNERNDEGADLSLLFDLKGLESQPNLDKVIRDLIQGVGHMPSQLSMLPSAPAGKTDVYFDGKATIPQNFSFSNLASYQKLKIKINKFDISSAWGHYHLDSAFLFDSPKEKEKQIHFNWNSKSEISEAQYQQLSDDFVNFAKTPPEEAEEQDPIAEKLHQLSICCEQDLRNAIPHYPALSPLSSNMALDIQINSDTRYNVDLKQFDIAAKPYGFFSKGQALLEENNEPKGIYKLEFTNYEKFLEDTIGFYNRALPVLNALSEESQKLPPLNNEFKSQVQQFLKKISDDPDKDNADLHVTVNFLDIQNMTIGTLSPTDVQIEWESFIKKLEQTSPQELPE